MLFPSRLRNLSTRDPEADQALISIIIPTLNEEQYLRSCLESLRSQTCQQDRELILVDNGSTDDSLGVAVEEQAHRILIRPGRLGAVRNYGAKNARGQILAFIDADTIADPYWLSEILRTFRDGEVVGVTGPTVLLTEKVLDRWIYKIRTVLRRAAIFLSLTDICPTNCAFRRAPFLKTGGFAEATDHCEDFKLARKIGHTGKFVFNSKMIVFTSPRRIEREGWMRFIGMGILNALATLLTGRSVD
jgi:glycosyltransferase involved in cell wall biosynthesis